MLKKSLPGLLCALLLLTGCGGEQPLNWTPTPATPTPAPAADDPQSDAPWAALTVEDLPTALADPEDMLLFSSPQVFLLGAQSEKDIWLYGLNPGYGGGILLRRGEVLTHFDQVFLSPSAPALPALYTCDPDGDGEDELAVRYLMEAQGEQIAYDLHFYDWDGSDWSDLAVTHEACAEKALEVLETDYNAGTGSFTLSYGASSAVYQLPEQYRAAPGRLTLDTCFFREDGGTFTVVLGARLDATGTLFANVLAVIDCEGDDFVLRDIRVEPTTVV